MLMFYDACEANPAAKTRRLGLIVLITLAGFILSFLYYYMRLSPPQPQSFLYPPLDRFGDFFVMLGASANPYASTEFGSSHFPFMLRFCWLFSLLPHMFARWIWLLSFAGFGLAALYKGFKTQNKIGDWTNTLIVFFLSYPVLFAIDRGNFETFVVICVYFFAVSLYKGKRLLAAVFLALAMALKPFPVVFLGLLLAEGEYKCAWRAALGAALLTFAGYLSYPGDVFETVIRHSYILRFYDYSRVHYDLSLPFGNSLFGAIKVLLIKICPAVMYPDGFSYSLKSAYSVFAVLSGAGLVWFTYRRRSTLAFWEKLALYICAMNLLPFVSGDYKLIHFLLPLVFFINEPRTGPRDTLYSVLLGLLLVPKSFFHCLLNDMREGFMHGEYNYVNVSVREGVILNPLLMLALSLVIICGQFKRTANPALQ
ncbi:MAG: glycosyltransferase family 87 protein [Elusimicrobiales bacterium]|nr:glycosyltransferase family 87 protein [Elusimicrobiales bacterium]